MPRESLVDKAKETVGLGQTTGTRGGQGRPNRSTGESLRRARRQRGRGIWRVDAGRRAARIRSALCITGRCAWSAVPNCKNGIAYAFGAEFVEVRVNRCTREIRVPRLLGAFAAGRIINPRTARSQLMGGLIWGMSSALHEATEIDRRNARYVNDNLADYLIPVNADMPQVEVILLLRAGRPQSIRLGIKGLGELGNVGTNAAVAMRSSTPPVMRIRKLPVRLERLEI